MKWSNYPTTLFSLCILALGLAAFMHPLYLSICQINHNASQASLEIAMKVFTEDLDLAMSHQGLGNLHLGEDNESEKANVYIAAYLSKQVQIKVDGKPVVFSYLGKEVEMDVTWCYVEVDSIHTFAELEVTNKLFMELFDPQRNLVHVRFGKKEKSMMLTKGHSTEIVTF